METWLGEGCAGGTAFFFLGSDLMSQVVAVFRTKDTAIDLIHPVVAEPAVCRAVLVVSSSFDTTIQTSFHQFIPPKICLDKNSPVMIAHHEAM